MSPTPVLAAAAIHKHFPGVHALKGVDLHVMPGEVLAVLGENGAGKSTLMKILAGLQQPDQGTLTKDGRTLHLSSALDAKKHGIALIHQELQIADHLNAAANVFLGNEPTHYGFVRRKAMHRRATELFDKLGFGLPANTAVESLSPGKKQLIEIARALAIGARIIIMDEPTASLSQQETEKLFLVISQLRNDGVAVIYISHRLNEIKKIADRVTILRDGENAGELQADAITHDAMVQCMVGRSLDKTYQRQTHATQDMLLEVTGLCTAAHPRKPASFRLHRGEILGIAGLVGAGRTELLRALAGVDPIAAGTMNLQGRPYLPKMPQNAIDAGVVLAPEDRKLHGLLLELSVADNLNLPSISRLSRGKIFRHKAVENKHAEQHINALQIKCANLAQPARLLSGGNQQKIVISKWLALEPSIFLLDEPTRGIDVGAKREIYALMDSLAAAGKAVMFVSSDMEEILAIADRVLVMHEGAITGEVCGSERNETRIMQLATGCA
jgi:ribose transport system ATP-binding protein